jgi:drug/metabolite transporter (DMT)-like permease
MKKTVLAVLGILFIASNNVLAECTLNEQIIPCDQMPKWLFLIPIFIFIIAGFSLIFWILMLIDIAKNEKDNNLIIWLLVLFFFGIIGAIIYYFAIKRSRKNINQKQNNK